MTKPLDESIILRLTLARSFKTKASQELANQNDALAIAAAIVQIHDCLDNLLGAAVSYLELPLPRDKDHKIYMLERRKFVADKLDYHGHADAIKQINTMRNLIKHDGLMPNTNQALAAIEEANVYVDEITPLCFGMPLDEVSLKELVKNDEVREAIGAVETLIANEQYEQAMEATAHILFDNFIIGDSTFSSLLAQLQNMGNSGPIFLKDTKFIRSSLVELGIDPYLYHRVGNLLPEIGKKSYSSRDRAVKYDGMMWHEGNWTRKNALFCIEFVTNLLIKKQKEYSGLYNIRYRKVRHTITAKIPTVIFDKPGGKIIDQMGPRDMRTGTIDGYFRGAWLDYHDSTDDYACISVFEEGEGMQYKYFRAYVAKVDISIAEEEYIEGDNV